MNKISKEYMGEIKTLFPIKKNPEKAYIKKLALDVEDYCQEANVTSKQELYDNYGMPYEVVSNYLSTVGNDRLVRLLRVSKFTRVATMGLLILATIATTMLIMFLLHRHDVLEHNRIVLEKNIVNYDAIEEDTYKDGFFSDEFN